MRCGSGVVRARGGGEAGWPRRGRAARFFAAVVAVSVAVVAGAAAGAAAPSRQRPSFSAANQQVWYFASTSTSTRSTRRFDLVTLKWHAARPPVWGSRSSLQCRATERSRHWGGGLRQTWFVRTRTGTTRLALSKRAWSAASPASLFGESRARGAPRAVRASKERRGHRWSAEVRGQIDTCLHGSEGL